MAVDRVDVPVADRTGQTGVLHLHGDETASRFDQPPGQQRPLAPFVPAIAVSQFRIFPREIERFTRLVAGQQAQRPLVELVHGRHRRIGVGVPSEVVERFQQAYAVV